MSEIPKFSYEDVFSEEQLANAEKENNRDIISSTQLSETLTFTQNESDDFFENLPEDTDWSKIHLKMNEKYKKLIGDYESSVEKSVITSTWLMGHMINQTKDYAKSNDRYQELDYLTETEGVTSEREEEKEKIREKIAQMNTLSAAYQTEVSKMIFSLRSQTEGKKHLEYFWQTFEQLSSMTLGENQTFSDGYKRGIEGAVATHDIFQSLGFETYFPDPRQDAIEGIDGWAKKGEKTVALQIKTHKKGPIRVETERLKVPQSAKNLNSKDAKEVQQKNKFLNQTNKYARNWQREVIPLWVDLEGYKGIEFQQDETGSIIIPPNFNTTELAQKIEGQLNES